MSARSKIYSKEELAKLFTADPNKIKVNPCVNGIDLGDGQCKLDNSSNPVLVSLTVITSNTGIITKQLSLGDDGSLVKTPAALLYSGTAKRYTVTLEGLAKLLRSLEQTQCLVHGVCRYDLAYITTSAKYTPGKTRGDIPIVARTAEFFSYDSGKPALLMLDIDEITGKITKTAPEVLSILSVFCPGLATAGVVTTPSTSSCLWLDDQELKGETGLHIYLLAKNGADIPRFGKVLFQRLWLAGYGHIYIDKAGRMHARSLIDKTVFGAERIDFAARAACLDGLEQRLPTPVFIDGELIDTELTLDLSLAELKELKRLVVEAKKLSAPKAALVRAEYVELHAVELVEKHNGRINLEEARSVIESRLRGKLKPDDWLFFDTLGPVQVSMLAADMSRFDQQTLRDPVHPEKGPCKAIFYVNNGKSVALIRSFVGGEMYYEIAKCKVWSCDEARKAVYELAAVVKAAAAEEGSTEEAEFVKRIKKLYTDIFQSNDFSEADLDEMRNLCKKKLGCSKETLDKIAKGARTEGGELANSKLPAQSSLADMMLDEFKNVWCYLSSIERWYHYDGAGLWDMCDSGAFLYAVKKRMSLFPEVVMAGYSKQYLNGVEGLLAVDLRGDMVQLPVHMIPFKNGVLDTLKGDLLPHSAGNNLKWQLEFDYTAGATCTFFQKWLMQRLGLESRVRLVRAIIGAILLGIEDLKFFVEIYGLADTGKSVFQGLLTDLVGKKNIGTTDLTRLETVRYEPAALVGKRMLLISDSKSWAGETPVLKAITGGDLVPIERKHKQQDGEGAKIGGIPFIILNQPLQFADSSNAMSCRRVSVPWLIAVSESEIKAGIDAILAAELPGIVCWALELGEAEIRSTIKASKGDKRSADAMDVLIATNSIASWLDENTVYMPGRRTNIGTASKYDNAELWLYSNYEKYLSDDSRNSRPLGVKKFGEALHVMLTETLKLKACFRCEKNTHGRQFEGLELRGGLMDNRPSPLQVAREMTNAFTHDIHLGGCDDTVRFI